MAVPNIILHSPISNEELLPVFVEDLLKQGTSLIAVFGPDSDRIEDIIDKLIVGDGSDTSRFICTSSHRDEPFEDVWSMVADWDGGSEVKEIRL